MVWQMLTRDQLPDIGDRWGELEMVNEPYWQDGFWYIPCVCTHLGDCNRHVDVLYENLKKGAKKCKHCRSRKVKYAYKRITVCMADAKTRCKDPNHPAYERYGGRGIEFKFKGGADAAVWVQENFTEEEIEGKQIDRIDNDGHYEPGNIRFVTNKDNSHNRSNNKYFLGHDGRRIIIADMGDYLTKHHPEVGYATTTLYGHYHRGARTVQDIIEAWAARTYGNFECKKKQS